jgi:glutamate-1-semialdehyde 2,1-aminomutase
MTFLYEKSAELHKQACQVLAGGVSSEFRRFGYPHPLFYERASGTTIVDADGNEYLDFALSQGPMILGHSHPEVLDAVTRHSATGQLYAGQHRLELELAERIARIIPCAELLRFGLSGSEADHAAIRVARGLTGRPKFLKFEGHYHGWFDNVAVSISAASEDALGPRDQPGIVPWSEGIPQQYAEQCHVLPWNDLELAEQFVSQHHEELAAIITEPVMCNNGCIPPQPGFLEGLRALCDRYGIVLIFDEVITGFRLAMGGAQEFYDVTPDLAIFGKAMANGYPISVLTGRRKFMQPIADGKVIHAGTMNSNVPGIAAGTATLDVLQREQVHEHIRELGLRLMAGLRDISEKTGHAMLIQGLGPMFHAGFTSLSEVRDLRESLTYDKAKYGKFAAGMHDRGVRIIGRGLWYISAAHTAAEIDHCLTIAEDVLRAL